MSEDSKRIAYAKEHNIHHLFELMATKVLLDRPANPFLYLRNLLEEVEKSEKNKGTYDPTQVHFYNDVKEGSSSNHTIAPPPPAKTAAADNKGARQAQKKTITLATFGLDNAGKTTMLAALGGNIDPNCMPTVGFTPTQFQLDDCNICIFDLGGAANFRGIWVHYFHDCHGVIYVIDSAAGPQRIAESLSVLRDTMRHPYLAGKPLLILANKKDLPTSEKTDCVPESLLAEIAGGVGAGNDPHPRGHDEASPYRVVATCSIREDSELDGGIEWMLETVKKHYDELSARVSRDSSAVKEEKARQREERMKQLREDAN